jgi:hypothetical protein
MQEQTRPQEQGLWLLVVLGTLLGFASISTDLYLPALPRMAEALGAEQSALELTVSGYLVGLRQSDDGTGSTTAGSQGTMCNGTTPLPINLPEPSVRASPKLRVIDAFPVAQSESRPEDLQGG